MIYLGLDSGVLEAYDLDSGVLLWTSENVNAAVSGTPAFSADGATVYVSGKDILAIDAGTGAIRWKMIGTASDFKSAVAVLLDGTIVVGRQDNTLVAREPVAGLTAGTYCGIWVSMHTTSGTRRAKTRLLLFTHEINGRKFLSFDCF
jgi:outer membrane protein assembly factor BamB